MASDSIAPKDASSRRLAGPPWLAAAIVLCLSLGVVALVAVLLGSATAQTDRNRFEALITDVEGRLERQAESHISLLYGAAAFFDAVPESVTKASFREFTTRLGVTGRFKGVRGVGFARQVDQASVESIERLYKEVHGPDFRIRPRTEGPESFPVILLEPQDARNNASLGFDMLADPARRDAMERARRTGEPALTGRVEFVREPEEERDPGFLMYLPVHLDRSEPAPAAGAPANTMRGFAYAPFRAGDFFSAALGDFASDEIAFEIYDESPRPEARLYAALAGAEAFPARPALQAERGLRIAGRGWVVRYASTPPFETGSAGALIPVVVSLGLLLAATASVLAWLQVRARALAEGEADAVRTADREKDLLLREMKHRIKNTLARVQAVARQTARSSRDLQEYMAVFEARLLAMGATHDLLTRSRWEGASLDEVMRAELGAIEREETGIYAIEGPAVFLTPREVMALGLAVHELTTNSLKYGALARPDGRLRITWLTGQEGRRATLSIRWLERGVERPEDVPESGFGSKLIDATIVRELGGRFERRFGPEGMLCLIDFPRQAPMATPASQAA